MFLTHYKRRNILLSVNPLRYGKSIIDPEIRHDDSSSIFGYLRLLREGAFFFFSMSPILVRASVALIRHHDPCNAYEGKIFNWVDWHFQSIITAVWRGGVQTDTVFATSRSKINSKWTEFPIEWSLSKDDHKAHPNSDMLLPVRPQLLQQATSLKRNATFYELMGVNYIGTFQSLTPYRTKGLLTYRVSREWKESI